MEVSRLRGFLVVVACSFIAWLIYSSTHSDSEISTSTIAIELSDSHEESKPQFGPQIEQKYRLANLGNSLCLGVEDAGPLMLSTFLCADSPHLEFLFTTKKTIVGLGGQCLDASMLQKNETVANKNRWQDDLHSLPLAGFAPCVVDSPYQQWIWKNNKGPDVLDMIYNEMTNSCLDGAKGTEYDNQVKIAPCVEGRCTQQWQRATADKNHPFRDLIVEPSSPGQVKGQRLLCWVLTMPEAHSTKATAVNRTWGPGCDVTLYVSSESYPGLNIVAFPQPQGEGRSRIWVKTWSAWLHVYENYRNLADWFMKADDDTYVHTTHLREFLSQYDPKDPHFFGKEFHADGPEKNASYLSGGAGYVLSHAALRTLKEKGESFVVAENFTHSSNGTIREDIAISEILRKVGVRPEDSRDQKGGERFLPFKIEYLRALHPPSLASDLSKAIGSLVTQDKAFWRWNFKFFYFYRTASYYPVLKGKACCAEQWVSAHHIKENDMYASHLASAYRCSDF